MFVEFIDLTMLASFDQRDASRGYEPRGYDDDDEADEHGDDYEDDDDDDVHSSKRNAGWRSEGKKILWCRNSVVRHFIGVSDGAIDKIKIIG